jgi:hypothetical protein
MVGASVGVSGHSGARAGPAVVWLALAIAGIVAFFWDGLVSLGEAWALPEYNHGPIIPLIAAWLMLRELAQSSA